MTSKLSFQEKFKDRLSNIGKDGIAGILKQSELPVYKLNVEINKNYKDKIRDEISIDYSPSKFSKENLFKIKDSPFKNKKRDENQNIDNILAKHGNNIIKNDKLNTPINMHSQNNKNIDNKFDCFKNGYLSQYKFWNDHNKNLSNPSTNLDFKIENNFDQISITHYGDMNSYRKNNFQIQDFKINQPNNNNMNLIKNYKVIPENISNKNNLNYSKNRKDSPNNKIYSKYIGNLKVEESFSSRFINPSNNLSTIDKTGNISNITQNNKSNLSRLKDQRVGSSDANWLCIQRTNSDDKQDIVRLGSPQVKKCIIQDLNDEIMTNQKQSGLSKNSFKKFKPYTLKEYQALVNEKITYGGLGPNIGTKEWEEKATKMKKLINYSEKIKDKRKIILLPIKESPIEELEKIKKEKALASKRTKALMYGKMLKRQDIKNYFSEKLNITNVYDDNRLDFANFKEIIENDEEEVTEFFKDEEIKINNYDFNPDIIELKKDREKL